MKLPKNFVEEKGSTAIGSTKLQYRLLADGSILDQHTSKVVAYISKSHEIEEAWKLRGTARQKYIREFVS